MKLIVPFEPSLVFENEDYFPLQLDNLIDNGLISLANKYYVSKEMYELLKKDGSKAEYTQIRARCGHYPDMFEALPGNFIKLKEDYKK